MDGEEFSELLALGPGSPEGAEAPDGESGTGHGANSGSLGGDSNVAWAAPKVERRQSFFGKLNFGGSRSLVRLADGHVATPDAAALNLTGKESKDYRKSDSRRVLVGSGINSDFSDTDGAINSDTNSAGGPGKSHKTVTSSVNNNKFNTSVVTTISPKKNQGQYGIRRASTMTHIDSGSGKQNLRNSTANDSPTSDSRQS